jgi:hypothetical protein
MDVQQLKRILIPDTLQVIICSIITLLIIGVVYREAFVGVIAQNSGISAGDVQQSYLHQLGQLNQYEWLKNAILGGFSAAVGIIAYIGYLMFANLVVEAHNEVVVDTQYTNQGRLLPRFLYIGRSLLLLAVLIGLFAVSLKTLLPIWLSLFEQSVLLGQNPIYALAAIAAIWLNIYLVWTWAQFTLAYR